MIPYFWGGVPVRGASGLTFSEVFQDSLERDLPEEVWAAMEKRHDEQFHAPHLRRIVEEDLWPHPKQ